MEGGAFAMCASIIEFIRSSQTFCPNVHSTASRLSTAYFQAVVDIRHIFH